VSQPCGLARIALMHLERATRCGVSRAELLREARLDEAQLSDPDARVPLSATIGLWRAITSRVPDPALGLRFGSDVRVREFGLVGYTMAVSRTVGTALRRLTRYDRILSDALVFELDVEGEATWARLDVHPALHALRPAADARLAALLSVSRELAAAPIVPLAVQFPYRRPEDVREYERFFRAPLEFGAPTTALLLRSDDLARPVACSDETLAGYLDRLAEQALAALGSERTLRDRVRRLLWTELSDGAPDLDHVARVLGMSARTFQRRLRSEGKTFAALLTEFRRDMAPALLRDGRLAVAEVAFLLGYEDPSSFQRAFRRWSGLSPRAFRRAPPGGTARAAMDRSFHEPMSPAAGNLSPATPLEGRAR
jgi:AraC-like DNA-binding protein